LFFAFLFSRTVASYCTFALTEEFPVKVNVQLAVLLAEHAPVHMATRPPETVNVTRLPEGNAADPARPTATLIPDGFEVTRIPLRPLAVTVSVAVAGATGAGLRVSTADCVTPPPETEMVPCVMLVTDEVEMLNRAEVEPAGNNNDVGTVIAGLLLVTWKIWSLLAGATVVTITNAAVPPVMDDWLSAMEAGWP